MLLETQQAMFKLQQTKNLTVKEDIKPVKFGHVEYEEFSDSDTESTEVNMPWLLNKCLINLGVDIDQQEVIL